MRVTGKFTDCDPLVLIYVQEYISRRRLMAMGFQYEMTNLDEIDMEMFCLIDDEYQKQAKKQMEKPTTKF